MSLLTGMRVVEYSAFVAVPFAGMSLAQMGAEVIRVDRLTGGMDAGRWPVSRTGRSLFWAGLNKGKKSIAVDDRHPEGRALVQRLVTAPGADAGILISNLPVKGWLDDDTLRAGRQDVITVTLKGDRRGHPQVDYTVNPALGIPDMTGPEGSNTPVAHALPAWDLLSGQLCVSTVLAAERHRLRTGAGQAATVALKDVAAAAMGHLGMIADAQINGRDRQKAGNALYGAYGQDFECADGRRVMVIGLTSRQWRLLVQVTETQAGMRAIEQRHGLSLGDEGTRWQLRHEISEVLRPWFAARPVSAFRAVFDKAGVTWSEFRTVREALERDPDLSTDNPMFTQMHQPGIGRVLSPSHPVCFSAHERAAAVPAPALGADTEEVLGDVLGLEDRDIARLFDSGVVRSADDSGARTAA